MSDVQPSEKNQRPEVAQPIQVKRTGFISTYDRIVDWMMYVCIAAVAFIMISICADVGVRFSRGSLSGLTEVATLLMVYMPFLGAAYVLRRERHITLDTILTFMRPTQRAFLTMCMSFTGILISVVLTYYGTSITVSLLTRGVFSEASIQIYKWVYTVAIPVGGLALAIQFARRMLVNWKAWKAQGIPAMHY